MYHPNAAFIHCSVGIGEVEVPDYAAIGKIYDSETKSFIKSFRLISGLDEIVRAHLLQTLPAKSVAVYPWRRADIVVRVHIYHFFWDEKYLMMDGMVQIGKKSFPFREHIAASLPKAIDAVLQRFTSFVTSHLRQICSK